MLIVAEKCPQCKELGVFPKTRMMDIDGEQCGPIALECDKCNWKQPDSEVIERWREYDRKFKKLNKKSKKGTIVVPFY